MNYFPSHALYISHSFPPVLFKHLIILHEECTLRNSLVRNFILFSVTWAFSRFTFSPLILIHSQSVLFPLSKHRLSDIFLTKFSVILHINSFHLFRTGIFSTHFLGYWEYVFALNCMILLFHKVPGYSIHHAVGLTIAYNEKKIHSYLVTSHNA
jgi:hypothetical protein